MSTKFGFLPLTTVVDSASSNEERQKILNAIDPSSEGLLSKLKYAFTSSVKCAAKLPATIEKLEKMTDAEFKDLPTDSAILDFKYTDAMVRLMSITVKSSGKIIKAWKEFCEKLDNTRSSGEIREIGDAFASDLPGLISEAGKTIVEKVDLEEAKKLVRLVTTSFDEATFSRRGYTVANTAGICKKMSDTISGNKNMLTVLKAVISERYLLEKVEDKDALIALNTAVYITEKIYPKVDYFCYYVAQQIKS